MRKLIPLIIVSILFTGCSAVTVKKLSKELEEFEKLGVKQIVVKTNFNSTDYNVVHEDGKRTATINHHSVRIPELKIVRETEDKK